MVWIEVLNPTNSSIMQMTIIRNVLIAFKRFSFYEFRAAPKNRSPNLLLSLLSIEEISWQKWDRRENEKKPKWLQFEF